MPDLSARRIAENLEILHAEVRMLRIIVSALAGTIPAAAREKAVNLLKTAADQEPRFVTGVTAEDWARLGITEMTSAWTTLLTP